MSSNTTNNYKGPYAIEPPSFKVDPIYLSSEHAKQVAVSYTHLTLPTNREV